MGDSRDYQTWLWESAGAIGDGITLLRNKNTGAFAVRKTMPAELRPVLEALSTLCFPNLPKIHSIEESASPGCIDTTEECISGITLRAALPPGTTLNDAQTVALGLDLCAAQTPAPAEAQNTVKNAPAEAEETPCTCTLVESRDLATIGHVFRPNQPVWNYRQGDVITVPVEFYWLRDESSCRAKTHDAPEFTFTPFEFVPTSDSTGETFSAGSMVGNVLTVKEAGSYHISIRTAYHGQEYGTNLWVEVPHDRDAGSVRPCTCALITEEGDARLHGVPFRLHPYFTFAPITDAIASLPYTAPLELLFPTAERDCRALTHSEQAWALSLLETEGAAIADGRITLTAAGTYHIRYDGTFNGIAYSGVLTIDAPAQ